MGQRASSQRAEPQNAAEEAAGGGDARASSTSRPEESPRVPSSPFPLLALPDEILLVVARYWVAHPRGLPPGSHSRRTFALFGSPRDVARRAAAKYGGATEALRVMVDSWRGPCPLSTIEALLDQGADPTARGGPWHQSPLVRACVSGNVAAVKAILRRWRDEWSPEEVRGAALGANDHFRSIDVTAAVLEGASHLLDRASLGSALVLATMREDVPLARLLLAHGAPADARQGRYIALREAAALRGTEILSLLLGAGADPNVDGGVALVEAIWHGRLDMVELLVEHGADTRGATDAVRRWQGKGSESRRALEAYLLSKGAPPSSLE